MKCIMWFKESVFILKMIYGEGAQVLLSGQKVIPARLKREQFPFQYPNAKAAIDNLL